MAEQTIRNSRESNIIEILINMQKRPSGVCINDIMEEYDVKRSTAERWLNAIKNVVPAVDEIENLSTKRKYWGFVDFSMPSLINFSAEEIANLERLKTEFAKNGFKDKEKLIDSTLQNIKLLNKSRKLKVDNNLEILMRTEGFAVKQAPKFNIDLRILDTIREAMKTNKKISAVYHDKPRSLCPLGLVYGEKIYLIAKEESKGDIPCYYILHKMSEVKVTYESFDRGDFDLEEFSQKSFGIYQGEMYDVKLLFSKNVAEDVLNYQFHSTQKIKQNEDGTVTVKFKASGEYEMMWHLFKWGTDVKILAPANLRKQYIDMLQNVTEHQKEK